MNNRAKNPFRYISFEHYYSLLTQYDKYIAFLSTGEQESLEHLWDESLYLQAYFRGERLFVDKCNPTFIEITNDQLIDHLKRACAIPAKCYQFVFQLFHDNVRLHRLIKSFSDEMAANLLINLATIFKLNSEKENKLFLDFATLMTDQALHIALTALKNLRPLKHIKIKIALIETHLNKSPESPIQPIIIANTSVDSRPKNVTEVLSTLFAPPPLTPPSLTPMSSDIIDEDEQKPNDMVISSYDNERPLDDDDLQLWLAYCDSPSTMRM